MKLKNLNLKNEIEVDKNEIELYKNEIKLYKSEIHLSKREIEVKTLYCNTLPSYTGCGISNAIFYL